MPEELAPLKRHISQLNKRILVLSLLWVGSTAKTLSINSRQRPLSSNAGYATFKKSVLIRVNPWRCFRLHIGADHSLIRYFVFRLFP